MSYLNNKYMDLYLRGPIPWEWIVKYAQAAPCGLFIGQWIWQQMDIQQARQVQLPLRILARQLMGTVHIGT
jgi:hypothetical protein